MGESSFQQTRMEAVGDTVHCEEQLRSTLHCDDKEKLRRKLALLKMEYLRTAQRLQRAERSEAVRSHVRSRITQQNHQDQMIPEVTPNPCPHPSSLTLDTQDRAASGAPVCQGPTEDAADSENSRRSVIRFLLPSDAACSQAPDSSHHATGGHRPSSALRLRSRRSRMRLERRSIEADRSTDNCEGEPEQSERTETARTKGSGERVQTELVNESEELFSGTDSESPSLLLSHWNTCEQTETGNMEAKETHGGQQQREKETESRTEGKKESGLTSSPLTCCNPAFHAEVKGQDDAQNDEPKKIEGGEEGETSGGQRNGGLCEDSSNKETEQNAAEKTEREKSPNSTVKIKEEKSEMVGREHDVNSASLLDSCTLVEGLLFPAEYYVRTTRRMSSSQSQPDMNAVILSQLNKGRHRRSRGRGRGLNRPTQSHECSDRHSQTDLSLLSAASPSVGPQMASQATDTSDLNSQSSRDEILAVQINTDVCFSPTVSAARPARSRRRGRGRGRGRPQTPKCPLSLDTHQIDLKQASVDPQPISSEVSSPLSLHEMDGPKPCPSPVEAVPVPDNPQPASTHSTTAQPSSGGDGTQCSSATEQQVYPIFLKSNDRTKGSTQINKSAANWHSLLLPSSPLAQTPLLPLPSLSPGSLVNNLMNFDIPQDFHLPDDQFASLKLHKLHQVAVESGVEHFSLPSHNTRSSLRRSESCISGDPVMPLSLPLSLTPVISNSPYHSEAKQAAKQCTDLETLSIEHKLTGKLTSQSSTEESSDRENPGEQQTENLHPQCQDHTTSTESVSVVQEHATLCVNQCKDKVILNTQNKGSISASSMDRSIKQPHMNFADPPRSKVNNHVIHQSEESNVIPSEQQTENPGEGHPLEEQRSISHPTKDKAVNKNLSYHCPQQKTSEEPSDIHTAVQACKHSEASGESPVQHLNGKSPAKESNESPEPTTSPLQEDRSQDRVHHSVRSQLLLSPPLASAPFITPQLHSSTLLSSPTLLPSLGLTPHPLSAALPLTSSPSAPALTTPPPHSPSVRSLSPPVLSPCPSPTPLHPSRPPPSLTGQIQASSEASQRLESAVISSIHPQVSGGQVGLTTEEAAEEHMMRCTQTLKAPAGGRLVDACCLPGSAGGLCVAAAGKWAVCLWSQTSASDWNLIHTWAFSEPVISVFPVLDADGLMCVTLGQLEIREVRMLSCSSLSQLSLCEGLVQAVVGASKSRVVTSSHSASQGSTLQVFMLSDGDSTPSSQPLMSPGVCVGALAPVDGLSDALIGTDEGGRLFIWNLKTGQLLRRIVLGDSLSHTACLQGYSYCGVLFVLLQHQLLSSLEEEEREVRGKDLMFLEEEEEEEEEERKKSTLFSLVAVNPLSGKSVVATRLYPPKAWSGRLCEADVDGSSVVGLSQSGCVCVWELGRGGSSRMVWAPESEGWHLARWGGGGTLVTGHHNGDVSLHCYSTTKTSICH